MSKAISYIAIGWGFLLVLLFLYTDLTQPKINQNSDYLMTFHTAGTLVREGNAAALYPLKDETSFIDTSFDRAAHRVLPDLPGPSTAEYMYMPLVALFFVPFSLLSSGVSLLAFQIVSLVALAVCAFLISNAAANTDEFSGVESTGGWIGLTLLPVAVSLWIGQVGIVFGLLPLCLGAHNLLGGRMLTGGLLLALAVFKPQFFVPALMVSGALFLAGKPRALIGMVAGTVAIMVLNIVIFGFDLFGQWLGTLQLAERVYSDIKYGVAQHIATSLPRAIILMIPVDQHHVWKPVIYAGAAVLGLTGLYFMTRLLRSTTVKPSIGLALAFIIAALATPVIVPHVFLYDYCLLLIAGYMTYALSFPESIAWRLKSLVWLTWGVVNIYTIVVLVNAKIAAPILFTIIMLELYRRAIVAAAVTLKEKPETTEGLS